MKNEEIQAAIAATTDNKMNNREIQAAIAAITDCYVSSDMSLCRYSVAVFKRGFEMGEANRNECIDDAETAGVALGISDANASAAKAIFKDFTDGAEAIAVAWRMTEANADAARREGEGEMTNEDFRKEITRLTEEYMDTPLMKEAGFHGKILRRGIEIGEANRLKATDVQEQAKLDKQFRRDLVCAIRQSTKFNVAEGYWNEADAILATEGEK